MGGWVSGVLFIVVGIVVFLLRKRSGRLGARVHNAAFQTDVFKPAWIEGWNFLFGAGLIVAGVVVLVISATAG